MKTRNHKLFLITPLVCATIMAFTACKEEAKQAAAETPAPKVDGEKITIPANAPQASAVVVEPVVERKDPSTHFTGRLIWNDDSTVRVFSPVAGRVTGIDANLGQRVSSGDALAKIASPDFGQAQADAHKAIVDLHQTERTLNRIKELFEHGAAAQKDVDSAEADYTNAVAEKERTSARLALLGGESTAIDQMFTLKAPIVGTVVEKNINPGLEVRPDAMMSNVPQYAQPLFVISDPSKLWLQLDVSESDMHLLKPGEKLRVQTAAYPDKTFEGHVEIIGDALDPNTRTVKVRAVVDNAEKLLKAEMYVNAEVSLKMADAEKAGVDVSAKAVFLLNNQHFIFVENSPGQFERRAVKLGGESNGRVFVEGLQPGQKVVTEGTLLLQALLEGDKS